MLRGAITIHDFPEYAKDRPRIRLVGVLQRVGMVYVRTSTASPSQNAGPFVQLHGRRFRLLVVGAARSVSGLGREGPGVASGARSRRTMEEIADEPT